MRCFAYLGLECGRDRIPLWSLLAKWSDVRLDVHSRPEVEACDVIQGRACCMTWLLTAASNCELRTSR